MRGDMEEVGAIYFIRMEKTTKKFYFAASERKYARN